MADMTGTDMAPAAEAQRSGRTTQIGTLAAPAITVAPTDSVRTVQSRFQGRSPLTSAVIVHGERPVGVLMSYALDHVLGTQYGRALFFDRPVVNIMDRHPLIVDFDTPVQEVIDQAMNRVDEHLYDDIVIMRGDRLQGTVSVQRMLVTVAKAEAALELSGAVAHELNQPLQVLVSCAGMLQDQSRGEAIITEGLGMIQGQADRMAGTIRKLQELMTFETMRYTDTARIVDLNRSSAPRRQA